MTYRYANVIANSSVILRKFKLKLPKDYWQSHRQTLNLQRKQYSTIEIADAVNSHSVLSKIFEKYGPHLRKLIISNTTLDDFTFLTILKCSSFLEELLLSEVTIERKLPSINAISIVHLTTVAVHHTNWLVFKFLQRSQITKLLINNYFNEGDGTRIHLVRMLANQYRLSELTLHGTSSKTLFKNNDFNELWNYQLSKFHIGCGLGKNSDIVDRNIIDFLILNSQKLCNVEMSIPNCEEITAFILLNLNNVTSLTLDAGNLSKDVTFYQTLIGTEANLQLTHLKLSGFFCKSAFVKVILNKYPAITHLVLDDWTNTIFASDILKFVCNKNPNVQQLFVPAIGKNADTLTFKALKQLDVGHIRFPHKLINFVQRNRTIETLKVGLVYIEQISSIAPLIQQTEICHLSFAGSNSEVLQMIVELIQKNTPETLQSLELSLMAYENYARLSSVSRTLRKAIKINFPNNNAHDLHSKLSALL